MIDKQQVISIAEKWLNTKEGYFLVDVDVTTDNRIVVEIDQAEGVWIDDCVDLSRFIEASLDRDVEGLVICVDSYSYVATSLLLQGCSLTSFTSQTLIMSI